VTETEATWESDRFVGTSFAYPDEPREPSQEAQQMTRDAVNFVLDVVANSRTSRAALLKLACVRSLFGGGETSQEIAKRFGVSPRAVQQVKKDLRSQFLGRGKK